MAFISPFFSVSASAAKSISSTLGEVSMGVGVGSGVAVGMGVAVSPSPCPFLSVLSFGASVGMTGGVGVAVATGSMTRLERSVVSSIFISSLSPNRKLLISFLVPVMTPSLSIPKSSMKSLW